MGWGFGVGCPGRVMVLCRDRRLLFCRWTAATISTCFPTREPRRCWPEGPGSSALPGPKRTPALPHQPASLQPRGGFQALPVPLPQLLLCRLAAAGSPAAPEPPSEPLPPQCPPSRRGSHAAARCCGQSPVPPPYLCPGERTPALPALQGDKGVLGPVPTALGAGEEGGGAAGRASVATKSCYVGPACARLSLLKGGRWPSPGRTRTQHSPPPPLRLPFPGGGGAGGRSGAGAGRTPCPRRPGAGPGRAREGGREGRCCGRAAEPRCPAAPRAPRR